MYVMKGTHFVIIDIHSEASHTGRKALQLCHEMCWFKCGAQIIWKCVVTI